MHVCMYVYVRVQARIAGIEFDLDNWLFRRLKLINLIKTNRFNKLSTNDAF